MSSLFKHTCEFCKTRHKQTHCHFDLDPHFMPKLYRCDDQQACMERMLATPEGTHQLRGITGLYFVGLPGLPTP